MDARDRPPEETPVQPVAPASEGRRALLPLVAIVAALVIGALRPWDLVTAPPGGHPAGDSAAAPGTPAGRGTADGSGSAGSTSPTGSSPADPYAQLWTTCGSPSGWRAATIQHWTGRAAAIRSWIAIEPVAAAGPLDPRIPFAPVATDVVTAIGYCAPLDERLRPPATARASLWAIVAGAALPLTPEILEPPEPNALGGLWRPAPEVAIDVGGRPAWAPGRYVLQVRSPTQTFDRWLGIEIEDLAVRREGASATPAAATPLPSASGSAGSPAP